jgi:predicted ATP-grasp superfamily ATP-dependent carboligase
VIQAGDRSRTEIVSHDRHSKKRRRAKNSRKGLRRAEGLDFHPLIQLNEDFGEPPVQMVGGAPPFGPTRRGSGMAVVPALIVIGLSARALAASARRAGFAALSIDVFGDDDTIALSAATIRIGDDLVYGLSGDKVIDAVASMVDRFHPIGLVYGSGFEDRADILESVSKLTPILGNSAKAVRRAKDPFDLAHLCAEVGVAHPDIRERAPPTPTGWLRKRRGGAGGAHIGLADAVDPIGGGHYYQRRVVGESYSALFVADGEKAQIVGFSLQWTAPTPAHPFRFGGVCGPVSLEAASGANMARAVAELVRRLGLVGLNSADFVVGPEKTWLIEVNPRPGISLDVFDSTRWPLMASHLAACAGRFELLRSKKAFTAVETVYASLDIRARSEFIWPHWTVDRPSSQTRIRAGDPFCTVIAGGRTLAEARQLVERRSAKILALAGEAER